MPPGSTARPPPPAAETVANHGAESSSREYAQPAAGWCRSGSQNPARSSRCDRLAVGHAAVRTAPSPNSDRLAAPFARNHTRIVRKEGSGVGVAQVSAQNLGANLDWIRAKARFELSMLLVRTKTAGQKGAFAHDDYRM